MLKQPAASDDFTHGKQTLDWIVLEKKSTCSPHPVAFNSDRHILSGCSAVVCVCVSVCECGCMPLAASRNRKQGKL